MLQALAAHPHAGADTVLVAVRRELGGVSTQAVYDVLNVLAERGVARRIQPTGSVSRYELRSGDNHHHVVCRHCGAVNDVDCATGEAPCLDASETPRLRHRRGRGDLLGYLPRLPEHQPDQHIRSSNQQGVSNA